MWCHSPVSLWLIDVGITSMSCVQISISVPLCRAWRNSREWHSVPRYMLTNINQRSLLSTRNALDTKNYGTSKDSRFRDTAMIDSIKGNVWRVERTGSVRTSSNFQKYWQARVSFRIDQHGVFWETSVTLVSSLLSLMALLIDTSQKACSIRFEVRAQKHDSAKSGNCVPATCVCLCGLVGLVENLEERC